MIDRGSLLHLRQRTYDPSLGRLLQPDSFSGLATEPASLHRYLYAANNPLRYHDPSGNLFVLFDGTWNHDKEEFLKPHEGFTNIVKMRDAYRSASFSDFVYNRGVGNPVDQSDPITATLAGISGLGLRELINEAVAQVKDLAANASDIQVTGFSRGATAALNFAHELQRVMPHKRIDGIYLFDTVASLGIPGNGINLTYTTALPANVIRGFHAIAYDEDRTSFSATNILDRGNRMFQKAFWGVHGDVGGGYRDDTKHSDHTLFWMSEKLRQNFPYFPSAGRACSECDRKNSHFPHPALTYFLHGGKNLGQMLRPTTEHPMPGVLALSFFYDDIDFQEVGLDPYMAMYASLASHALFLALTDAYAAGLNFAPYIGVQASAAYRIYHYATHYFSMLHFLDNRI
jgi:RHS repeat-associated protein